MAEQIRIAHCEKAELYTSDGSLIAQAVVRTTESSPQVILPQQVFADLAQPQCRVLFYDERGLIDCECCFIKPVEMDGEKRRWQCKILQVNGINNRRKDVKVATDLKITIADARHAAQEKRPNSLNARLINLSARGAYISSFLQFQQGDSMRVYLPIAEQRELVVSATVVRPVDNLEPEGGCRMYGHGCQFDNLTMEDEGTLRQFVFSEQLKNRNKARGITPSKTQTT